MTPYNDQRFPHSSQHPYSLENFEGPLDFLLYLVQKQEIAAQEVTIIALCEQFLDSFKRKDRNRELDEFSKDESSKGHKSFEEGAEFIALTSFLLWLKSRSLLPKQELSLEEEEQSTDPRFGMVEQLLAYSQIKQLAKDLQVRQEIQSASYSRGAPFTANLKKPPGIEHLSIDDLTFAFQGIIARQGTRQGTVSEEEWKVADKIAFIRGSLKESSPLPITALLHEEMGRSELVATFLAILELMKNGELFLYKENELIQVDLKS